ncbi:hypothetical protein pb186bvf_014653 [Paramecium bursaria]
MSFDISVLQKTLASYINRPSKLADVVPDMKKINELKNSLTILCTVHDDPKFEYDGDTKCSIGNDILRMIQIKDFNYKIATTSSQKLHSGRVKKKCQVLLKSFMLQYDQLGSSLEGLNIKRNPIN